MQTQACMPLLSDVSIHPYASWGVQVSSCLRSLIHFGRRGVLEIGNMTRWLGSSKMREMTAKGELERDSE